jgi:hypothetical protein
MAVTSRDAMRLLGVDLVTNRAWCRWDFGLMAEPEILGPGVPDKAQHRPISSGERRGIGSDQSKCSGLTVEVDRVRRDPGRVPETVVHIDRTVDPAMRHGVAVGDTNARPGQ